MPQISPPSGHSATRKNAAKRPKYRNCEKIGARSDRSPNEPGGRAPPPRGPRTASHTGQTRRPPRAATRRGRLRRSATNNTQKTREPNRKPPEQAEEQKTENSEKAKARHRRRPRKNNCVNHRQTAAKWALGTAAQFLVHAVPSLPTHVRPCTPDFGPGTSALRSYRVEVGWATAPLFCTASEQVPRRVRADSTGAGHPSHAA